MPLSRQVRPQMITHDPCIGHYLLPRSQPSYLVGCTKDKVSEYSSHECLSPQEQLHRSPCCKTAFVVVGVFRNAVERQLDDDPPSGVGRLEDQVTGGVFTGRVPRCDDEGEAGATFH